MKNALSLSRSQVICLEMCLRKTNSVRICIKEIKGEETGIEIGENFCYEQRRYTKTLKEK